MTIKRYHQLKYVETHSCVSASKVAQYNGIHVGLAACGDARISTYNNVSSTDSTLCAQPCYCQTVETHSCVSASCQVFATGDFIRQSCLPRRKNASLQVFVELTLIKQ